MTTVNLWQEFQKQYMNTFFRIKLKSGAKRIVYWHGSLPTNEEKKTFTVLTKNEGELVLKFDSTKYKDFDLKFPPVGMYNLAGVPWAFLRIPQRQWHRGICKGTALIRPMIVSGKSRRISAFNEYYTSLSHETLAGAFWSEYPATIDDACNQIDGKECFGRALNRELSIILNFNNSALVLNKLILYWYSLALGYVDPVNKEIKTYAHPLTQEVRDYLKRSRQGIWQLV
jgi:hypothetical protein